MNIDISNAHCGPWILFLDHSWLRVVSISKTARDAASDGALARSVRPAALPSGRNRGFAIDRDPVPLDQVPLLDSASGRSSASDRRVLDESLRDVRSLCAWTAVPKKSAREKPCTCTRVSRVSRSNEKKRARTQKLYMIRPQSRRDYPLNLSILLSGGKETN